MKTPDGKIPQPNNNDDPRDLHVIKEVMATVRNKDTFSRVVANTFLPISKILSEIRKITESEKDVFFNEKKFDYFLKEIISELHIFIEEVEMKEYEEEVLFPKTLEESHKVKIEQFILQRGIDILTHTLETLEKFKEDSVKLLTEDVKNICYKIIDDYFYRRKKLLEMDPLYKMKNTPDIIIDLPQFGDENIAISPN
ncbi:MAG: hypothetical protein KBB88_01255 [Candidatus Pacebacteria bacterium]|nr:hypothetical protein [Candidatus Paceibacterota bacterium]